MKQNIPENWELKKIGSILKVRHGKNQKEVEDENGKYPILGTGGVIGKTNSFLYNKPSVLIGRKGTIDRPQYMDKPFWTVDTLFYTEIKDGYDPKWVYYKFCSIPWKKYNEATGVPSLSASTIQSIKIEIPTFNEQKKIASILSTWDKVIELIETLTEKKKAQKKGLMQKLLTGEVRLPGFDDEWMKVSLGELGTTYNGLSGKKKEDFGEGVPYIPYKTIFDDSKIDINKLDFVKIAENEKQNQVQYGDIFFTTSSETPEEVGMSSVLLDEMNELYLNSFCFGYRLNSFERLLPEFARFLFRGDDFRRKIFKLAQGSTRFNISKNEVMKINVFLPSIEEQRAIVSVLSSADNEIKLLQRRAEYVKLQKKGLMQQLLSGKVRVKV